MYAIIETGGKQYRVQEGDVIVAEKLNLEVGAKVEFDRVLVCGEVYDDSNHGDWQRWRFCKSRSEN